MWILVQHEGQQLGPYNEAEVRAALQAGTIHPADLAWVENTPAWVPLESLFTSPAAVAQAQLPSALSPSPYALPDAPTSVLAIVSLVFGITSLLCFFAGIPAILCGHAARAQIARGYIRQQGSGLALAGMILGYLTTLPILLMFVFGFSAMIALIHEGGKHASLDPSPPASVLPARAHPPSIAQACERYALAHAGVYPDALEELIPQFLPDSSALLFPQMDQPGALGFWYFGAGQTDPAPDSVLLVSRGKDTQGRRMIVRVDGTSSLEQSDPPTEQDDK